MEPEHSQRVIKEPSEILIEAKQMQVKIFEGEGNAILFYKLGEAPDLEDVYSQDEKCCSLLLGVDWLPELWNEL